MEGGGDAGELAGAFCDGWVEGGDEFGLEGCVFGGQGLGALEEGWWEGGRGWLCRRNVSSG